MASSSWLAAVIKPHSTAWAMLFALAAIAPSPAPAEQQLLLSTPATGPHEEPRVHGLVGTIAAWLSAELDLPSVEQPRIERVSGAYMVELRLEALEPVSTTTGIGNFDSTTLAALEYDLVSVYHDARRTIYLQQGWSGDTPREISILVHEMVHHVQNLAGLRYECVEARERLAYEAQGRWLSRFGRTLENEFSIDPMTLLLRTNCRL